MPDTGKVLGLIRDLSSALIDEGAATLEQVVAEIVEIRKPPGTATVPGGNRPAWANLPFDELMDQAEAWRRGLTNFESHVRLRELVDMASFMAWAAAPSAECVYVNQYWLDYTGTTFAEQLGDGWLGRIHPKDRERCRKTCFQKSRLGESFHNVYRLRRADGSYSWALDEGVALWTLDGEFSGYAGTVLAISDSESTDAGSATHCLLCSCVRSSQVA